MSLSQTSTFEILTHPPLVSATSTDTLSLFNFSSYHLLLSNKPHAYVYIYIYLFNLCILLVAHFLCRNISSRRAGIFFCICNPYMWASWWLNGTESACHVGDEGSIPGLGLDPLERKMATQSYILAWEIPWTEEPGGLQSMGSPESDMTLNHQQPLWVMECLAHSIYSINKVCCKRRTVKTKLLSE